MTTSEEGAVSPAPPRPGGVLFDMDGVLVDTFEAWVAVLDECRRRRGLSPLGAAAVRACWGQGIQADCETLFPEEAPERLAREYEEVFSHRTALVRPEDGVRRTVRAIHRAGLLTAVVTNSPVALADLIVRQIGLGSEFDVIAGGDEVPRGKPDPDLIVLALERLSLPSSRAVLVGDTTMDLEAARAAGVPMIGYRFGARAARIDRLLDLLPLIGVPEP